MNSRMLICLDIPRPIAGIWIPLLSVITGPADIAIVWGKLKNARKELYAETWSRDIPYERWR